MSQINVTNIQHETGAGSNITLDASGDVVCAADVQMASQNGGQLAGFRNQIINGDFRIAQRGTIVTETTPGYRTLDRWYVGRSASCEEEQVNTYLEQEAGTSNTMRLNPGNAGNIRQMIEIVQGQPGQFQIGTTWTLSFYCNRDGTSLSIGFADGISGGTNYVQIVPSGTAAQRVGTTNRYTYTFTIASNPDGNNKGVRVGLQPSSTEFTDFTGVQLEPGPVATPFEHRPIGMEQMLCARYYINFSDSATRFLQTQNTNTEGDNLIFVVPTGVPMRTTPSVIGRVYKIGTQTGSSYGNGVGLARVLNNGPFVRVHTTGLLKATEACVGRIETALDAEL